MRVRLSAADRADLGRRLALRVDSPSGNAVGLSELARIERTPEPQPIVHKDLKPVVYVFGDLAGARESPVYALGALNEKLARSQIIGGTVGGIGHALLEETVTNAGTGRIANATLGDYLVPVNADIGTLDVIFVGGRDRMTPIGTKGVGEVGLAGVDAAIANAVFHATGRRIRRLPITIDQLL